ncbi:MAG: rod shape-determining protein MreC, partial [Verrucomicrobia bacterium]|nr:rod shape-determining protein MreC [Verrucomicrobiota bacterium]
MRVTSIVSLTLFIILVALVFISPFSYRQHLQNFLYQTIAPFLETGNAISQHLGGVRGNLKRLDELERANEQLERENEQLRTANALLRNLQGEVSRLDQALGFEARSPFQLVPARVIARDSASWWSTCTINRGKRDGVEPDMAVVTEGGLVGKIATAANSVSIVLLISDESLRVSVSVEGTPEQGIL